MALQHRQSEGTSFAAAGQSTGVVKALFMANLTGKEFGWLPSIAVAGTQPVSSIGSRRMGAGSVAGKPSELQAAFCIALRIRVCEFTGSAQMQELGLGRWTVGRSPTGVEV